MKTFVLSSSLTPLARVIFSSVLGLVLLGWIPAATAIPLTGANGQTAEFAGIKSVGPKGMIVQFREGDDPAAMTWDKFDLEKVRSQHPEIDAAYQEALTSGETIELNMGSFAPKAPAKGMAPKAGTAQAAELDGFYVMNVRPGPEKGFKSAKFGISLPAGNPKGILLVSRGQDGRSIRYVSQHRESGPWGKFQSELDFVIMSYDFSGVEVFKAPPFIFADKGSGEAVLQALDAFSEKTGKNLTDLPIAIYGLDVLGAAFAFNFAQWKPDRVIAAVVAKGGFYAVPPTSESAKVPLLMIWGEYNDDLKTWEATHTHAEVFGNHVNLKPNWIDAMEPRGQSDESPQVYQMGKKFLEDMIEKRMSGGGLIDLDRSEGWVGDLESFEISKLADPEAVLTSTQTWLPDSDFAEMWKQFVKGELPISPE